MKNFKVKWLLLSIILSIASINTVWATDYYYRGGRNSWGATKMTVSTDGYYVYYQASSGDAHQFKIATSESGWDYNYSYVKKGYNNTDVSNIGDFGSDNCYCWQSSAHYILVYLPNTNVNSTSSPIICASTTLPSNSQYTVYYVNQNSWTAANVKAYLWTKTGDVTDEYSGWAGTAMTDVSKTYNGKKIYKISVYRNFANIIFSNNGADSNKTGDLTLGSTNKGKMFTHASSTTAWQALAYDVTLNADGGSGGTSSIVATCGSAMPGSKSKPSTALSGYTFQGYYTAVGGGGTQYYTNAMGSANNWPSDGSGPTTLYAKWTQSLSLNQNGATSDGTTSVTATYKGGIGSISDKPSKTGYDFQGYFTNQNGTGSCVINASKALQTNVTDWTNSSTKWIHSGASTLYAKWTQTVTLDANTANGGSTNGSAGVIFNGGKTSYSAATASDVLYALEGYYTGATSGDKVMDEDGNLISNVTYWTDESGNWIHAGASTLYAHWKTTYTLKYNGNGATSGSVPDDSEETRNSSVTAATQGTLVRTGYTFTGWNTRGDGEGSSITAGGSFTITSNTTLYAQWSENTVTLTPTKSYTGASSTHVITGGGSVGITTTQTLTAAAAGTGYIFNGWTLSSNLVITSGTTSSLSITVRTNGDGEAVSAVAKYTEDLSTPLVLKGGTAFGGTAWSTSHALTKKTGFSTSSIAYITVDIAATNNVAGTSNGNYQFKIYNGVTAYGLTGSDQYWYTRETATSGNPAGQLDMSTSGVNIELRADKVGSYEIKVDYSSTPYKITIGFPGKSIVGDFNDWNGETNELDAGMTTVSITKTGNYEFKVYDGGIWLGNSGTISSSEASWVFTAGGSNCTLNATETGDYIFGWNSANHELTVIYPSDQAKMKFTAQQYVYFDATGQTNWNASTFTTRFWFKHYATGEDLGSSVDCTDAMKLEGNVYYARVADNANVGQVQLNRMKPDLSKIWCTANKVSGFDRTNANQNCMETDPDDTDCDDWTPLWKTYCPPISTATLTKTDATATWGGNGGSSTPYLVPTGSSIYVSASATQPLTDPNMTTKYQFKANSSNDGSETSTNTHTFTASNTSGTSIPYTVTVRNHFNSTTGTSATSSAIYFEARTPYTITYNAGTYGTGTIAGATKLKGVNFTLSSMAFSRTGYRQVGWATSDGGDKAYDLGETYSSDAALDLYPVWEVEIYEITLDPDNGNSTVKVTATYGNAMSTTKVGGDPLTAPTYVGYTFGGYWSGKNGTGTQYYDASAASAHNWDQTSDYTLYAKWIPNTLTFNATSNANWNNTSNWSEACVPTIEHPVVLAKPVEVNINNAKAKSVVIDQYGGRTGKLTVSAGKKLIVATTIQKKDGEGNTGSTEEDDLIINSDGTNGVGALVWGTANSSPGEATVNFYSLSGGSKNSNTSVNQFIGTPFTKETSDWLYNYYNSWVLGVNYSESSPAFYLLGSDDQMEPFKGYCVIYNGSTGHTYNMSGTLVTNEDHTCSSLSYKSGTAANIANENLLANPWLAPIKIGEMQTTDFTNADATIYIFNSTSASASVSGFGNYSTYPIASAGSNVIPAMQSFSVFTTGSGGSVALDYSKIVYDPAVAGTLPVANKAPKRVAEDEANNLRLYVNAESGYGDMIYMRERSDFNEGFENGWDGHKIAGDKEAPQFYAITPDGNMAVNCVPNFEGTVMGFKAGTEDSEYTFTFDYEGEQVWYLNDLEAQQSTLIDAESSYNFSAVPGAVAEHRFVISHSPIAYVPTGIDNSETVEDVKARKLMINGILYIIRGGRIYSTDGQMVK